MSSNAFKTHMIPFETKRRNRAVAYHLIKAFKNNTTNNVKRRADCYKPFARAYTFKHFIRVINESSNQTHFPLKDPHENIFLWRFTHEAGQFMTRNWNLLWELDCNTVTTDVLRTRHCSIWSSHGNHCYHPRSKHSPRENPHSWRHTGRTRSPRIDVTISR